MENVFQSRSGFGRPADLEQAASQKPSNLLRVGLRRGQVGLASERKGEQLSGRRGIEKSMSSRIRRARCSSRCPGDAGAGVRRRSGTEQGEEVCRAQAWAAPRQVMSTILIILCREGI